MKKKLRLRKLKEQQRLKDLQEQTKKKHNAKYQKIVDEAKAFLANPKIKQEMAADWKKQYAASSCGGMLEPRASWHEGPTFKKSILDYAKQDHIINDTEALNQKRKELGLGNIEAADEKAKKEILAKSKRVAVQYNKGAYQYVTEDTNLCDLGQKTSSI